MTFDTTIGLEVHAQLHTRTKLFCACLNRFGDSPNVHICPVCMGVLGAMPALNKSAVDKALEVACALKCTIPDVSIFSRKNYFYPDLPKGYQITQGEYPLAIGGRVRFEICGLLRVVELERIHIEEDAGKSEHGARDGQTLVDFNRAGVPLVEIVSKPDLRSADEAVEYTKALRRVLVYLEACQGGMQRGEFRVDANISLKKAGSDQLGVKVELKNLNSFRHLRAALEYEVARQQEELLVGNIVSQQTRQWDEVRKRTVLLRSKETAADYRYFSEPDLPPLVLEPDRVESVKKRLPEMPLKKKERFCREFGFEVREVEELCASRGFAEMFTDVVERGVGPSLAKGFFLREMLGRSKLEGLGYESPISLGRLVALLKLVESGMISRRAAKVVFERVCEDDADPAEIAETLDLTQISDPLVIERACDDAMKESSKLVEDYQAGKTKLLGYFVGQIMKATGGRADPALVHQIAKEKLDESV